MERNATGQFTTAEGTELEQGVSLSLTQTAWAILDEQARQQGISQSELIERYARGLQSSTISPASQADPTSTKQETPEQTESLAALDAWIAGDADTTGKTAAAERSTHRKLVNILSRITDAFVALDCHWRYIYVNEAASRLLQQPKQTLLGNTLWEMFPDLQSTQIEQLLRRAMDDQTAVEYEQFYAPLNLWVEVHVYPSVDGLSLYFRDIYDRKQAEADRRQAKQERSQMLAELSLSEQALRDSEERFRAMFNQAAVGINQIDLSGRFLLVNPAYCKITGYSQEELVQMTWQDVTHPDDIADDLVQMQRLLAGEIQEFSLEKRYIHKTGAIVWVNLTSSAVRDSDRQTKYTVGIIEDITDRVRVEDERKQVEQEREQLLERERMARAAAEAAQQQLTTIFETSPVGIGLLDSEQRYTAINEALAEINGLTREQHLGQSISDLFGQSDPNLVQVFHTIYTTGQSFISPNFAVNVPGRRDRRPGYYNVFYLPNYRPDRSVESVLVYVVDVTDHHRLEQTQRFLAESSHVLASSLDYQTTLTSITNLAVPQLADWCTVHIVDDAGTTRQLAVAHTDPDKVAWAQELQRRYPYDPNATRGAASVICTGQSELYSEISDTLLEASARDPEHLSLLRQVGFSSIMIVPIRTHGRTFGAISFVAAESGRRYDSIDLSLAEELGRRAALAVENAQLYDAAQRDRAKAEAANRIKDEFLAVLSHELRSPLNPILGWTKLLRTRSFDKPAIDRALEVIERNARLQAQLIEDLLDVSRILQGKMVLNVTTIDLVTTIKAALETVRLAAEAKSIQIHTQLAPVGPVNGDANRLQQVIWNVLSNAIKFTPSGGRVEIRLEPAQGRRDDGGGMGAATPDYAQIQIQDTGKGISPEFLPHVFDYFQQEDSTTTRRFGGLGLGLAIVRHLTELHGGTVEAESPGEGQGATFTIRLPLPKDGEVNREAEIDGTSSLSTTDRLTGIRILLVDDDPDMRELAIAILEPQGAELCVVASAAEALSVLDAFRPQVLVSDIGMPEVNGYTLMTQVRQRSFNQEQPGTKQGCTGPIGIALTAYAGEFNQQQAQKAGFQQHIAKPVEPAQLVEVIRMVAEASARPRLDGAEHSFY